MIKEDILKTKDLIEDQEIAQHDKSTFSLKIVLTELDALKTLDKGENLPKDINEVARIKHSLSGLKESPFFLGTKETVVLFDEL
jgi:hypothetical protein